MSDRLTQAEYDEQMTLARVEPLLSNEGLKRLWKLRERSLLYGSDGIKPRQFAGLSPRYAT